MRPSAVVFMIGDEYRLDDEMQTLSLGLAKYLCKPLEPPGFFPIAGISAFLCPPSRSPVYRIPHRGSAENNATEDLPEPLSLGRGIRRSGRDQVILPFNPDFRRRPAA